MADQLIFTSSVRGLKPGASGYCTVLKSPGMRASLEQALERLSIYEHNQRNIGSTVFSYRTLSVRDTTYCVVSRVSDAGKDYTGRTNFLAHYLVFTKDELPAQTPADLLLNWPGWCDEWSGDPCEEALDLASLNSTTQSKAPAKEWTTHGGGSVRAAALAAPSADRLLLESPAATSEHLLQLIAEVLAIRVQFTKDPALAWATSFSVGLVSDGHAKDFKWLAANWAPEPAHAQRRTRVDVEQPVEGAVALDEELLSIAKTGHYAPPPKPIKLSGAPVAAATHPEARDTAAASPRIALPRQGHQLPSGSIPHRKTRPLAKKKGKRLPLLLTISAVLVLGVTAGLYLRAQSQERQAEAEAIRAAFDQIKNVVNAYPKIDSQKMPNAKRIDNRKKDATGAIEVLFAIGEGEDEFQYYWARSGLPHGDRTDYRHWYDSVKGWRDAESHETGNSVELKKPSVAEDPVATQINRPVEVVDVKPEPELPEVTPILDTNCVIVFATVGELLPFGERVLNDAPSILLCQNFRQGRGLNDEVFVDECHYRKKAFKKVNEIGRGIPIDQPISGDYADWGIKISPKNDNPYYVLIFENAPTGPYHVGDIKDLPNMSAKDAFELLESRFVLGGLQIKLFDQESKAWQPLEATSKGGYGGMNDLQINEFIESLCNGLEIGFADAKIDSVEQALMKKVILAQLEDIRESLTQRTDKQGLDMAVKSYNSIIKKLKESKSISEVYTAYRDEIQNLKEAKGQQSDDAIKDKIENAISELQNNSPFNSTKGFSLDETGFSKRKLHITNKGWRIAVGMGDVKSQDDIDKALKPYRDYYGNIEKHEKVRTDYEEVKRKWKSIQFLDQSDNVVATVNLK